MSYLTLGITLLQECYTSHMVDILHFQILQSGKAVLHQCDICNVVVYVNENYAIKPYV